MGSNSATTPCVALEASRLHHHFVEHLMRCANSFDSARRLGNPFLWRNNVISFDSDWIPFMLWSWEPDTERWEAGCQTTFD